jgi:hypothetical protein
MAGEPRFIEEEVERVEQVTGRLMRAVRILSAVGYNTTLESCQVILIEAEGIVSDIDWERLRSTVEFYCEERE